jgi:hypothetical protein
MATNSLDKLSNEDLTYLYRSMRESNYDDKASKIIQTLDDDTLASLYGNMRSEEDSIKQNIRSGAENAASEIKSNPLQAIPAAGIAAIQGAASLPVDIAGLVVPGISKAYHDKVNQDPIYDEFPSSTNIAYGAGSIASAGPIGSGVKAILKGASKIPGVIGQGAKTLEGPGLLPYTGREAATGALIGASVNPENKLTGATYGFMGGLAAGGIGRATGGSITGKAVVAERELQYAKQFGLDIDDPQVLRMIQKQLDEGGSSLIESSTAKHVAKTFKERIDKIKPDGLDDGLSPNEQITQRSANNFEAKVKELNALEAPLKADNTIYKPESLVKEIESIKSDLASSKTISANQRKEIFSFINKQNKTFLNQGGTIKDSIEYKRNLANQISQKVQSSSISKTEKEYYLRMQDAVEADIANAAKSSGLEDSLIAYNNVYKTQIKPYEDLVNSGRIKTPKDADELFQQVNTLLGSSNPNITKLKTLTNTLGPDGSKIIGWAILENAYNKALLTGNFNPNKFLSEINKYNVKGLGNIILTSEHKEAMKGLRNLAEGAKELLKRGDITEKLFLEKIVNRGLFTRSMIKNVIIPLGSTNPKSKKARELIQSIMTIETTQQLRTESE